MPARATAAPTRRRAFPGIVAAAACVATVASLTACSGATTDDESSIVKTTTMVAGAGVVGLSRDTSTACPLPTPPDVPDGGPKRIVVLSTRALDTTCALGVWESVVGASTDGSIPKYLGKGIADIPSVGSSEDPDLAKIAELKPDLILGTQPQRAETVAKLQAIAPTTFDNVAGGWRQQFIAGATALGRTQAGQQALLDFQRQAADVGTETGSAQTEASLVRFTADSAQIEGNDTFAGGILGDAGVRRPASQRGASEELNIDDPTAADGDLIYVVFDGKDGEKHGTDVMTSAAWENLGAVDDHRLFTVDEAVWNGSGLTAARTLLGDLRESLNGYTS